MSQHHPLPFNMSSLLEALEQKYGESSTESEGSEDEGISVSIFVPCKSPRAVVPALLVLNDCDIATAGEKDALIAKCAGVEELDLAKNKLNHWPEHMPRLKFVNLSFNVLSTPLREVEVDRSMRWQQLQNLVLNSTYICWESVQDILDHLPGLEELHLSLNDYNNVYLYDEKSNCTCTDSENDNRSEPCSCQSHTPEVKVTHKHSGIRILHFRGNLIENWKEVRKLGYAFPNLETLILADCPIRSLEHEEGAPTGTTKGRRASLSAWNDIERLSKFPALECVRVQGCPLWDSNECTEHERRQLFIARLPNVKTLNGGGKITVDEREDAERAFIRYYMDKPESDRPERYLDLVQIHGKLDPLVNVDLRPEKRVKVKFSCGSNSEVKSVDVYLTVTELKSKLETFAGFSAARMRLYYVDQELPDFRVPEEMKYPSKRLYSYNIRSGDEIIIDFKKKINHTTK
ncbi:hypothetical protein NQ318_005943 [Aromia moschata]|uniref:Ubiquitin-like domain-containing protein n=1 Tax=Aromia moschata TaxID=1265417 RepID=A0AAV8YD58_9CUCU|nr:hypothetical protein NQ318_005943 [Aromia moschata]